MIPQLGVFRREEAAGKGGRDEVGWGKEAWGSCKVVIV